MEDEQIVALYWERSEAAITETKQKYNGYCSVIANNILNSHEETEECVSDTWLKAWNSMPPKKPSLLSLFLGKAELLGESVEDDEHDAGSGRALYQTDRADLSA